MGKFFALSVLVAQGIWAQPQPLFGVGHPVDWWFVFKFNSTSFPGCAGSSQRACIFGGDTANYGGTFSQQYIAASKPNPTLKMGTDCLGDDTIGDPLGATFAQVYYGSYNYVLWNDQFKNDPMISGCSQSCSSPWGHSKGMVAWDSAGNGFVLQVTTPSWPASGNATHPRTTDGNTLGCVKDNDVVFSQHFFALKLSRGDLAKVLKGLKNASVVTNPKDPQIVRNGGPSEIQALVNSLGKKSDTVAATMDTLSSGIILITKSSAMHAAPWQLVSSLLGGLPLRTATWWTTPTIATTTAKTPIDCRDSTLPKSGAVEIATSGQWNKVKFGLKGAPSFDGDYNHAKIGISTDAKSSLAIFGDLNQQGSISNPNCGSSQNGRGGLFYVVKDSVLHQGIKDLIGGSTAPTSP